MPATQTATPLPRCKICDHADHWLGDHIMDEHGLTLEEYHDLHPGVPVLSDDVANRIKGAKKKRQHPPTLQSLTTAIGGISVSVNTDVPDTACLPLPDHYRVPVNGKLAQDIREAAIALSNNRSLYIWGMSGTGKDAFVHAWSYLTRTPARIFQIQPGVDIEPWLFTRGFDKDSTHWEEGELLKAARDGYLTKDNRRVPYIILITDYDRATKAQAEVLRLITDSIEGRIPGPGGKVFKVLPGTVIVATANTSGGGDERGRYTSSNVIDASLMGRFERKIEFRFIDWKDEEPVIKAKYPEFARRCGKALAGIGRATQALRKAIADGNMYADFSHRDLCTWIGHAQDILSLDDKKVPKDLLKRAARMFLCGLPDEETRLAAKRLIDPHIKGGALDRGDTSGMSDEDIF